ncbi:hypothetical protein DSO57_1013778 [Entomophthora muscae]|uniref:Uncharacterized protein n=1 Tax=Entomophthora muscae TaxID=34485 RepID=A0ACC2S7D9_9FUNG|nr:hypothetical protein DSO57_1013778 [Entomophthora muscae]
MGKKKSSKQLASKDSPAENSLISYDQDLSDKDIKLRSYKEEELSIEDYESQTSKNSNLESETKEFTDLQLRYNSEEHLKAKFTTVLKEVEEVEYFDHAPQRPSAKESLLHSQRQLADARNDRLETFYYAYRVLNAILNLMLIMFLILTLSGFAWVVWNDITRLTREHEAR